MLARLGCSPILSANPLLFKKSISLLYGSREIALLNLTVASLVKEPPFLSFSSFLFVFIYPNKSISSDSLILILSLN